MALACRLCRVPLSATAGCEVCRDYKRNLISSEEDTENVPTLSDVSREVVASLRLIIRRGRALLEDTEKPDAFTEGTALTIKAGNTAAKVLESARKLQTDGLAAIRVMSFLDRAELFLGWYADLPPPYRQKVRDGMVKLETEQNKALPANGVSSSVINQTEMLATKTEPQAAEND